MACQSLGELDAAEQSCRKALALLRKRRAKEPDEDKHALRELFLLMRLGRDGEVDALLAWLGARHPENPSLKKIQADWHLRNR